MFYASFNDVDAMLGYSSIDVASDMDIFPDDSDTDRTGLDTDIDNMEDTDVFEEDDESTETFEDLDGDDVEVGEDIDEESINEVDLDFNPENEEPDWSPDDEISPTDEAQDISYEDENVDTANEDEPYDEESETSPDEEIYQDSRIIQDDIISQLEETGFDESLIYPDEDGNDIDADQTDEAMEEIELTEDQLDYTDATYESEWPGQVIERAGNWVDSLEDFLDFTEQDVESFHDEFLNELLGPMIEGIEVTDGYDPPVNDFLADEVIELSNIIDDVFTDLMLDETMGDAFFAWFDSLDQNIIDVEDWSW